MKLILLPGLDGTGLLFEPLLEQLSDACAVQVIRYSPDQCQSMQTLAAQVREQVVFDSDTVLLAESFSGLVAMELLRQPIPLHSVIFCASFASAPRPWLLKLTTVLPLEMLFRLPLPNFLLRGLGLNTRLVGLIRQVREQVSPAVLVYRLRLIAAAQTLVLEKPWDVPCYYWQAADDWAVPARCAEALRQYFTAVTVTRIQQSGHFLLQSQPVVCAAIIETVRSTPPPDVG
ncbi:alpha/beta fold hydrolase [Thiothrix subterranea]|uniref:alpha/beta fold hydrolase n=1 Tax=Thiothrix subterranea TaxID=2735563 RepID=UPI00192C2F8B|nr:alpha/beta fold hydrolase [Thiothrix subterranea]QQZ28126.1 alpha/beta fold hydrolase [Thiothrix subterranea]